MATRGSSAVEAVEKLAAEVQFSAALHATPVEQEQTATEHPDPLPRLAVTAIGGGCLLLAVDIIVEAGLWSIRSGWALLILVVTIGLLMCWGAA